MGKKTLTKVSSRAEGRCSCAVYIRYVTTRSGSKFAAQAPRLRDRLTTLGVASAGECRLDVSLLPFVLAVSEG